MSTSGAALWLVSILAVVGVGDLLAVLLVRAEERARDRAEQERRERQ